MLKDLLVKNTLTNYLVVLVRLFQGILVTRWLVADLGAVDYGLWALLWAIFAYMLLLDFGFGMSAQKYTASGLYLTDLKKYNEVMSAVVSYYSLMALFILLFSAVGGFYLTDIFKSVPEDRVEDFRLCFILFGVGTALVFPTGIFPEILVGLRKIYARNYVIFISKILELFGTLLILRLGGRLLPLILLAVVLPLSCNAVMAVMVSGAIKGFRIKFLPSLSTWREIAHFSLFAYLTSIAKLLLNRGNHIIVGIFCGFGDIGVYHLSGRLAELCTQAGMQYQENVNPTTAGLFATGRFNRLREFIFHSMLINCIMGSALMLPTWLFAGEAMEFLFKVNKPEIVYLAQLAILTSFWSLVLRPAVQSSLLMAGQHKFLAVLVTIEALTIVLANILLLPHFGLPVVFYVAMIGGGVFSLILMWRAFDMLDLSWVRVLWRVYLVPFALSFMVTLPMWKFREMCANLPSLLVLAVGCALSAIGYLLLVYFFAITPRERDVLRDKFGFRKKITLPRFKTKKDRP